MLYILADASNFSSGKSGLMESKEVTRKRMRVTMEEQEADVENVGEEIVAYVENEGEEIVADVENVGKEIEANVPPASEEMEADISHIVENIESFTQLVWELLESGKTLMNDVRDKFEERMILIHKEQVDKWVEEINELRLLGSSIEKISTVMHNVRHLMNVQNDH